MRCEALRRILLECKENDYRKFLLSDCVEAYLYLDEQQHSAFEEMLQDKPYTEIVPMMQTTYEKGMEKGKELGKSEGRAEELLQAVCSLLEHRFGALSSELVQQLEQKSFEQLRELLIRLLDAPSLEALGLKSSNST